jgi:hypothetical protein
MTRYLKIPVIGEFRDGEVLHSHLTPARANASKYSTQVLDKG